MKILLDGGVNREARVAGMTPLHLLQAPEFYQRVELSQALMQTTAQLNMAALLLFHSKQRQQSVPDSTLHVHIDQQCETLKKAVLVECNRFWNKRLQATSLHVSDSHVNARCLQSFDVVWASGAKSSPSFSDKYLLLKPLLSTEAVDGKADMSYMAQLFWTGASHRLGSRAAVDITATLLNAEDVQVRGRALGQILRSGVWAMDGPEKVIGSGPCHSNRNDTHFFTWVSEFYAGLGGKDPHIFVFVNKESGGNRSLEESFLWKFEAPIMGEVCRFPQPGPAIVFLDFRNQCGNAITQLMTRIQESCSKARSSNELGEASVRFGIPVVDGQRGEYSIPHACACPGCARPKHLVSGTKLDGMWSRAMKAVKFVRRYMKHMNRHT